MCSDVDEYVNCHVFSLDVREVKTEIDNVYDVPLSYRKAAEHAGEFVLSFLVDNI